MTLGRIVLQTAYLGIAAELAGVVFGLSRWTKIGAGKRLIILWLAASATSDLLTIYYARHMQNSQLVAHYWFLATVIFGVEALRAYQHCRQRALVFRCIGVAYFVAWLILSFTIESSASYSTYLGPLEGLVLLGAAVATLFRRVAIGRHEFLADSGFLIAAAVCGVAILAAFQTVVAQLWMRTDPNMLAVYYALNNLVTVLAAIVIVRALQLDDTARPADAQ